MKTIYLDNAATTKVDESVVKAMLLFFVKDYGNASSKHFIGEEAKTALEKSRKIISKSINAKKEEIFFTSGGTESNNWALKGLVLSNPKKNHIITTKAEHDCVLKTCKFLEKLGVKITYLNVNQEGFINLDELKKSITSKTLLVSIIHGNNEIGTIQNLEKIGKICREKKVLFHTDACQSYTKTEVDVKKQNLDLVTLNSHKIHGPKGVGALYIKKDVDITPLLHGGGQEKGFRSSTENIPGIVGFAKAVKIANKKDIKKMEKLRDYFIEKLKEIPNTKINGALGEKRLCNNINVCFNNISSEAVGDYLTNYNICSSVGSACSSNLQGMRYKKSHVLKAIGLNDLEIKSSMRMSISKYTTKKEIDYVLKVLLKIIKKLRRMSPIK